MAMPASSKSLDAPVPIAHAMGPLLKRLGITTYRDAMTLDLEALKGLAGVGKIKMRRLRDIRTEALERALGAGAGFADLPPAEPTLAEWIEQSPRADWTPGQALGWLPTRALEVIEELELKTVAQLARWHENVSIADVANYGPRVHREVRQRLEALRDCGGPGIRTNRDQQTREPDDETNADHVGVRTPTSSKSLDEPVPVARAMGPLLNRLGIATYRHAMMLDLNELEKLTGIGKTKFKCLRDIRAEAFERALRAGATLIHLPPVAPTLTEWIEQSPWADWTPAQALGWLPTRVTGVIERFNLQTLAQLARWHANVKIDEVANYGGLVHRKVRQKLEALRDVGHEQLVFAGPQPQSIQALADRYLRTLKTERMRDVFKLRYIEGQTLEWIAERFGVTHERVRQIQANALRDDRPAWGPKAHALLKAGIARLKLRGGVARTAEVMAALAEPSSWAVHLALDLADLNEVLQIDVLPGISTTLSRDDFDALQRSLRAEVESGLKANLLRTVVEAAFAHHDLRLSPADVPVIAKSLLNVVMEGDRAWPQRRSTRAAYLGALRDAGGPTSAAELAEAVNTRAPALEATPRNVASTLRKTEQALHVGSGLWLHAAHCAKKFAQNVPK